MAGAIVAAIVLTVLLPEDIRLGPQWVLPSIEALLLVAVIAADPRSVTRRARELRVLSIGLVSVLVIGALWSTALLIDDLIHGGPETNSASDLLEAGSIVLVSNGIAFALLYWELDGGGAAAARPPTAGASGPRVPAAAESEDRPAWLAAAVHRLPLPQLHQLDRVQPDRRDAARAVGEDRDGRAGRGLARDPRPRDRTGRQHLLVAGNGFGVLFVILNSFGLGLRLSVGKLLAEAFAHWKIAVWALVINFVIIPLLFIGYLLTIASSIPGEIKVGFCVAALCAGMPFAPLLARLAKADVSISTTLLVVLTVATDYRPPARVAPRHRCG